MRRAGGCFPQQQRAERHERAATGDDQHRGQLFSSERGRTDEKIRDKRKRGRRATAAVAAVAASAGDVGALY